MSGYLGGCRHTIGRHDDHAFKRQILQTPYIRWKSSEEILPESGLQKARRPDMHLMFTKSASEVLMMQGQ